MTGNVRGRYKFDKFKKYILFLSKFYGIFSLSTRIKLLEFHRMTKGIKGIALRYALLKSIAIECGDNVSIHPGVYLLKPDKIIIGDNVSIHPMCYIDSTGGISIGSDVSIAHGTTIMSTTHGYEDISEPIKDQEIHEKRTVIADNIWIGAKATILAGINISEGSIVAAGAVVTSNIEKNKIVGGVPAKVIKDRL
jgi:acetyltransferase-like isoleucine patch superfamily enzyme